jgi:hypothetical protein
MESKPEIYFSYAWGDETESGTSREKIVNDLYDALVAAGFTVIRDKNDLRYKGLISDLAQRMGRGKFIVVAISDKYLKSTYCMSELLEIYRRSNSDLNELLKKIFPIVLEDAKIYNPEDRVDYLDYWETKKEQLNKELKAIELENASTFAEELRLYDEITAVIPVFSRLLKDMNTLNVKKLSANNFADIKDAIIKAASPVSVSLETISVDKPKNQSFLTRIRGWKAAIIALVVIGLLALFLHLAHLSSTEIRMELSVSELNFTLPQQQVVTNIVKLSSIGASGLENVQVLIGGGGERSSSAVLLSVDTINGHSGSITMDALSLPAGMRIGIRNTDVSGEYRFFLQGKAFNLPLQVNGSVKMIAPPNPPVALNYTSPGLITLQAAKDGVDLDLNFQSSANRIFPGQITADSISLLRIDEHHDDESSTVRTVSTILSGTLHFESLSGKKQILVAGQQIQLKNSRGTINKLELFDDHIAVNFVGTVSGMSAGGTNNRTSLMPTYLQWLKSRVSLSLLAVVLLIVLALTLGAFAPLREYFTQRRKGAAN